MFIINKTTVVELVVVVTCNLRFGEVGVGRSGVHGLLQLHDEFNILSHAGQSQKQTTAQLLYEPQLSKVTSTEMERKPGVASLWKTEARASGSRSFSAACSLS